MAGLQQTKASLEGNAASVMRRPSPAPPGGGNTVQTQCPAERFAFPSKLTVSGFNGKFSPLPPSLDLFTDLYLAGRSSPAEPRSALMNNSKSIPRSPPGLGRPAAAAAGRRHQSSIVILFQKLSRGERPARRLYPAYYILGFLWNLNIRWTRPDSIQSKPVAAVMKYSANISDSP